MKGGTDAFCRGVKGQRTLLGPHNNANPSKAVGATGEGGGQPVPSTQLHTPVLVDFATAGPGTDKVI
jgi:hypothetical protein